MDEVRRILLTGWFSFPDGEATAGDVPALDRVREVADRSGLPYDVAWSPGFRFVDDGGGVAQLSGPARSGVDDAVFDDGGLGGAVVPHQPVEVGDVDEGDAGQVGGRVAGVGHVAVRGVVLQVDQGRAAAQPLVDEGEFVGALEDHEVDVRVAQALRGEFDDAVGPVPGAGAAEAVAGGHGGGPGEHAGQFGGAGAAAEVEAVGAADVGGQLPLARAAGEDHPVSGGAEFADHLGAPGEAPGPGGDAGAGVQHHVGRGAGQCGGVGRQQDPGPAVVDRGNPAASARSRAASTSWACGARWWRTSSREPGYAESAVAGGVDVPAQFGQEAGGAVGGEGHHLVLVSCCAGSRGAA